MSLHLLLTVELSKQSHSLYLSDADQARLFLCKNVHFIKHTSYNRNSFSVKHQLKAKPRASLTAPNRDHFARVSLTVLDNFLDAIAKAKKLICESIAQNLKQVSLTKSFLALAMAFNLLLSNPT